MTLRKPALGTVLGATALAVALTSTGGVAEAAKLINGKFIKANTVTTKQIKDGTIAPADLSAAAKVAGPPGPTGATGPKGDPGAAGSPGLAGLNNVTASSPEVAFGAVTSVTATCSGQDKAISATAIWFWGYNEVDGAIPVYASGNGFRATAKNPEDFFSSNSIRITLVCAKVG
jgi:hypothetical protein